MISLITSRGTAPADQLLADYRRKRDFSKTPEPVPKRGKPHQQPIFVVQEHHARRLHYDLRLEADGVLKSWAVTKIPSMDPTVRRLAVRTEDHPLEYANFEGDIPKGQYGAGHVEIWDRGTYENLSAGPLTDALNAGKVEIEFHGKKLKGKFALIRMAGIHDVHGQAPDERSLGIVVHANPRLKVPSVWKNKETAALARAVEKYLVAKREGK
jgi:DNA ligase D-like protein (predicted 3'-phosphoesterase)